MKRTVLITGASSGIGAATAHALVKDGWQVYAGVRNVHDGQRLREESPSVTPVLLDVTNRQQIGDVFETIASVEASLDALISNAGIALGGPLEYLPIEELRHLFEVNLFGALAVTQTFLPMLRQAPSPHLVFVGSISGRLPIPYIAPYSASKFALRSMSEALRVELAPTISVSLIEPGNVKTPIWRKGREKGDSMRALIPQDAPPHYHEAIEALLRQTEIEERNGMPVERVTDAIRHALSPRARANYIVGTPARIGSILAMFPASIRDRLLHRASVKGYTSKTDARR